MDSIICHNAIKCYIYQNWMENIKGNTLSVIMKDDSKTKKYSCRALDELFDVLYASETEIPDNSFTGILPKKKVPCDIIELLNNSLK